MKVLIKLGGTLLDKPELRAAIATQIAQISKQCDLAVVHGGGKQVTKFLEERGVSSTFVNGLRVSDEVVIDAVTKVIAGSVNKQFVAALAASGCRAVGLSGVDGGLVSARPVSDELKFTGKPEMANSHLLDVLSTAGYLPVIACIAGDSQGQIFNVNADQLAVSCAVGWGAHKLFFLTDVPGVKGSAGDTLAQLDAKAIQQLISSGVATGGMQAKLEASVWALESGLDEVIVASGQAKNICSDLLARTARGTSIRLSGAGVQ